MPSLAQVLVFAPDLALLVGGCGLLSVSSERWPGGRLLLARVAVGVALLAVLLRAPHLHVAYVGAPLAVLAGTWAALVLASGSRAARPRCLGWLLIGSLLLLRLATWPSSRWAPYVLALLLAPLVALAADRQRGGWSPASLAWLGVALPAGLLPVFERAVAGELVAPAVGAWTGALVVCLGHALAARAPRVLGFGGGVLLAQAGALTVLASLSARGAVFGVLPGALVASALPCLGLVGVISILCESRRGRPVAECAGLLPRNRWLAAALVLSLLGLVGLPLTVGFAPRVRLVMAGAGAGLLAPVGLVVINAVVLLVLSLRLLRPLLHVRATESEPFVGESGATLLTALTAAAVVVSELAWPGFGGGG